MGMLDTYDSLNESGIITALFKVNHKRVPFFFMTLFNQISSSTDFLFFNVSVSTRLLLWLEIWQLQSDDQIWVH